MAKKKVDGDVEDIPAPAPGTSVFVHTGHSPEGAPLYSASLVDEPYDPAKPPAEVHISGEPHVQVGQTADGVKVYAHRDVRKR